MSYQYKSINTSAHEIRLLTLKPGKFQDNIHISLEHTHLAADKTQIPYEALSYVWGSEDDKQPIYVDSTTPQNNTILITKNLDTALRHLRKDDEPKILWVDAVCIDQTNLRERGHQVSLMGDIYRLATNTILWLGPEENESNTAVKLLKTIGWKIQVDWSQNYMVPSGAAFGETYWADNNYTLDYFKAEQSALCHIFSRPWFERLWIRQEVFLSPKKTLHAGYVSMSWDLFSRAVYCLYARPYYTVDVEFDKVFLQKRVVVYEMCLSVYKYITYGSLRHTLRDLRWKDPRDAIFAVGNTVRPADRRVKVTADYQASPVEVYTDVAVQMATRLGDLSFLTCCEIESIGIKDLPSWVPDWSTPMKASWVVGAIWSSCAWISAQAEHASPNILHVSGIQVTQIKAIHALPQDAEWYDAPTIFNTVKSLLPSKSHFPLKDKLSSKYVGGSTLLQAYIIALHRGRTAENFARRNGSALTSRQAETVLRSIATSDTNSVNLDEYAMDHFLTTCHKEFIGRSFFTTKQGYIGLGPAGLKPGDVVCVLLGLIIPVVLRETARDSGRWQVVGTCLVPGLMNGEAIYGNWGEGWLPVRGIGDGEEIDGHWVGMKNTVSGKSMMDPVEILEEHGVTSVKYERKPHVLEVEPSVLKARGVKLETFDLV